MPLSLQYPLHSLEMILIQKIPIHKLIQLLCCLDHLILLHVFHQSLLFQKEQNIVEKTFLGGLVTGEAAFGLGTVVALVLLAGILYLLFRKGYQGEESTRRLTSVAAAK